MPDTFALLVACARSAVARAHGDPCVLSAAMLAAEVTDWDSTLDVAAGHGLVPVLCRELLDRSGTTLAADIRDRLSATRVGSVARALAASAQLASVLTTLSQSSIRALAYKGPALALDAYADPSLRESDDLDIVVAPADLGAAYRALAGVWYAPSDGLAWSQSLALNGWQGHVSLSRIRAGTVPLPVELHWRFCDRKLPWTLDIGAVMTRATVRDISGARLLIPDVHDQLVLVLLHAARHGWDRLEGILCASLLLARGVEGETVLARAREAEGVRACLIGLAVAERLLGAQLPMVVRSAIERDGDIAALVEVALARLRAGDAGDSRDARLHLASLDSLTARVRYVLLAALLPTARDRETVILPRALNLFYVPLRLTRLLVRSFDR